MALRRTLAGLLAVPGLLLAGCGGDSSVADPPVRSSATSSATSSPAAHETAEHFIRRWVGASNALEKGGAARAYLSLSRGCKPCSALARQITRSRKHGGYYKSQGWTVRSIQLLTGGGSRAADLRVISAPTDFKTSADANVRHYTGGQLKFRIFYVPEGDSWRVTNVAQLAR